MHVARVPSKKGHVSGFRGLRRVVGLDCGDSLTKQSFMKDCDINVIMKRYEKDGLLAHTAAFQGEYGDFSSPLSYQEALHRVMDAQEMFLSLPSSIRSRFENDPGQFLAFVLDPANLDEVRKMGLGKPLEVPLVQSVKVVEMPSSAEGAPAGGAPKR